MSHKLTFPTIWVHKRCMPVDGYKSIDEKDGGICSKCGGFVTLHKMEKVTPKN